MATAAISKYFFIFGLTLIIIIFAEAAAFGIAWAHLPRPG
jgi:hypothetical protein